jgi:hypothetical protein
MRNASRTLRIRMLAACCALTLVLSACGSASHDGTPTASVDAIYTAAVQTFVAQQATQLALTPPTATASPIPIPTLPSVAPLPTLGFMVPTSPAASACDNAVYVADVTIPDGTVMTANQKFDKKWKILNSGTCTWSSSYSLGFDSGQQMGGSAAQVTVPVPPGNQTTMTLSLTAPATAGSFTGTWRMRNASSVSFGSFLTVVISVGTGGPTVTPGPSPTGGPGTYTISGNAGVGSVKITYTGTTSGDVTDDGSGNYTITVPSGWTGTLVPSKGSAGNYAFTPANKTLVNVTSNQVVNFTATLATPATATP